MDTVGYMARTREYYAALGYEKPYVWAAHDDSPFTALTKPLSKCRLAIVTTAATYDRKPFEPRHLESSPIHPAPERLYANDLAWAKESTHMDDRESYFPLANLEPLVAEGVLGSLAERFHCVPTSYSQRRTTEDDAPEVLRRLREDDADIALLVPL